MRGFNVHFFVLFEHFLSRGFRKLFASKFFSRGGASKIFWGGLLGGVAWGGGGGV